MGQDGLDMAGQWLNISRHGSGQGTFWWIRQTRTRRIPTPLRTSTACEAYTHISECWFQPISIKCGHKFRPVVICLSRAPTRYLGRRGSKTSGAANSTISGPSRLNILQGAEIRQQIGAPRYDKCALPGNRTYIWRKPCGEH